MPRIGPALAAGCAGAGHAFSFPEKRSLQAPRTADESHEQVRRNLEVLRQPPCVRLADGSLSVDDVGCVSSGLEDRQQICLAKSTLLHQIQEHLTGREAGNRISLRLVSR